MNLESLKSKYGFFGGWKAVKELLEKLGNLNDDYVVSKDFSFRLEQELSYSKKVYTETTIANEMLKQQLEDYKTRVESLEQERRSMLDRLLEKNNVEQVYRTVEKVDVSKIEQPRTIADIIKEQRDEYYRELGPVFDDVAPAFEADLLEAEKKAQKA